jgi:hypothetical protein
MDKLLRLYKSVESRWEREDEFHETLSELYLPRLLLYRLIMENRETKMQKEGIY